MTLRTHRIRRASTWWVIGCALHAPWSALLIAWVCDSPIMGSFIDWVRQHRQANRGGPAYVIAYGYVFNTIVTLLALGIASWIVASFLQWRESKAERRIKRGLCPACAYPVGTSDVCTECGRAVKR